MSENISNLINSSQYKNEHNERYAVIIGEGLSIINIQYYSNKMEAKKAINNYRSFYKFSRLYDIKKSKYLPV